MAPVKKPSGSPSHPTPVAPLSVEALERALGEAWRSGVALRPLAGGHSAEEPRRTPVQVVDLKGLPQRVSVDRVRGLVTVSAQTPWASLESALEKHGLVHDLVGTDPWRSVGGTLSEAALLPPLWLSGAPASRLVGLEALTERGEPYRAPAFPRTSSGPDWKSAWVGREGRAGVLLTCTFEVLRTTRQPMHLPDPNWVHAASLQRVLAQRPSTLRIHRWHAGIWTLSVVGQGALASKTAEWLLRMGAAEGEGPSTREGQAAALLVAPWSVLPGAQDLKWTGAALDGAGPTHVRLLLPLTRRRDADRAARHCAALSRALEPLPLRQGWRRWRPSAASTEQEQA